MGPIKDTSMIIGSGPKNHPQLMADMLATFPRPRRPPVIVDSLVVEDIQMYLFEFSYKRIAYQWKETKANEGSLDRRGPLSRLIEESMYPVYFPEDD